ncbi:hypothetical protein TrRE_jg3906, partial [Triparma retinervis]
MADKVRESRIINPGSSSDSFVPPKTQNEADIFSDCRRSLFEAGYVEVTSHDLQLCSALNAGYLLRLSLAPDLRNLDSLMRSEFMGPDSAALEAPGGPLFEGKVLMFRRGYGTEVTDDRRLIIPKLDYLQASLVQRNAAAVSDKLAEIQGKVDDFVVDKKGEFAKKLMNSSSIDPSSSSSSFLDPGLDQSSGDEAKPAPSNPFAASLTKKIKESSVDTARRVLENDAKKKKKKTKSKKVKPPISLKRYGSGPNHLSVDPSRALNPFLYTPEEEDTTKKRPDPDFVIPRVSISDVVDLFSPGGRRRLIAALFSKSKLVEPTYESLIVIHRPTVPPPTPPPFRIPNFVYNLAEIFNIDRYLPPRWSPPP